MIKRNQALKIILKNTKRLPQMRADLLHTLGHVLADDIISPIDFPPFSKSAMDGYALAKGDKSPDYLIVGEVAAGEIYKKKIQKGTAVKIMTGAMIPANTGQVVMKEHVQIIADNHLKIQKLSDKINICRQGEDLKKGSKLYAAGNIVTPVILSGLSFAGLRQISVYRRPAVGIMITGSELLRSGNKYQIGKIYDSNGPLLKSLLTQLGLTKITAKTVKDSLPLLKKNFRELLHKHAALFLTGGVSVGEYDYIYQLLQETGCRIHFNRIAVQPGKPLTFATYKNKPIFCFPGNPVSVFTSYHLFALPALYKMMGAEFSLPIREVYFAGNFERRRTERELYFPVSFLSANQVEAIRHMGSGDLYSLSKAEALMIVPIGKSTVKNGEKIRIIDL